MAFISGASRGIGLALVRRLLAVTDAPVVAAGRSVAASAELDELRARHGGRLTLLPMDVACEESVAGAVASLPAGVERLELVAHCAAMMHPSGRGETSIARVDQAGMAETLAVNVVGPTVLTRALWPRLRRKTKELEAGLRPGGQEDLSWKGSVIQGQDACLHRTGPALCGEAACCSGGTTSCRPKSRCCRRSSARIEGRTLKRKILFRCACLLRLPRHGLAAE